MLMTFEKRRDDFFHHKILGLPFLRYLGLGFLTTGTGDLAFRPGRTKAQIIYWPNVCGTSSGSWPSWRT
jgi:hypothetical protein